jgi:hypothetical protein
VRALLFVACFASVVVAEPTQLPKECAAESPVDEACTAITGRYRIELAPRQGTKSCVLAKKASAILTVSSEGRTPSFDAKPLVRALNLRQRKDAAPVLGADIRDGVCCLDLRLYGRPKKGRSQRVMVHMAAGASVVRAKADERWVDDVGPGMCGDEDLDVTVTKLR